MPTHSNDCSIMSIDDHMEFISEDNRKVKASLLLDIRTPSVSLARQAPNAFRQYTEGLYENGKLTLSLDSETPYLVNGKLMVFNTASEYLRNPCLLHTPTTPPFLIKTSAIAKHNFNKRGKNWFMYGSISSTPTVERTAAQYVKMVLLSIMAAGNPNGYVYTADKDGYTVLSTKEYISPEEYLSDGLMGDLNSYNQIRNSPHLAKLTSSLVLFMEKYPWGFFRLSQVNTADSINTLIIDSFGDKRIQHYHQEQINKIQTIKQDINDGKIHDPEIISLYSSL